MPGGMVAEFEFSAEDRETILSEVGATNGGEEFIRGTEAALTLYFHLQEIDMPSAYRDGMARLQKLQTAMEKAAEAMEGASTETVDMLDQAFFLEFRHWPRWTQWSEFFGQGGDPREHFERLADGLKRFIEDHHQPRKGAPVDHHSRTLWRRVAYLYQHSTGGNPATGADSLFVRVAKTIADAAGIKSQTGKGHADVRSKLREARRVDPDTWGEDPTEWG